MAEPTKWDWEQRLHEAAATVEDELRRVITYLNDEVVPEVRQNSSAALRMAAAEMERLARRLDDRKGAAGAPPPPPGRDSTQP
jgi:glutamyl-tRNA reductase